MKISILTFVLAVLCRAQATGPVADFTTTVAGLPPAASFTNKKVLITDGASACDVTIGGGTTRVMAVSNGTNWVAPNCGAGGGGSGDAAGIVSVPFSASPTFTCPSSSRGTFTTFAVATLTGDITSSTLSGCTPGQWLGFSFTQDVTGGHKVAWPSGFSAFTDPSPFSNATTNFFCSWNGTICQPPGATSGSGVIVLSSDPGINPSSSSIIFCWGSTTQTTMRCRNSSGVYTAMAKELTSGQLRVAGGADTADSGITPGTGVAAALASPVSGTGSICLTSGSSCGGSAAVNPTANTGHWESMGTLSGNSGINGGPNALGFAEVILWSPMNINKVSLNVTSTSGSNHAAVVIMDAVGTVLYVSSVVPDSASSAAWYNPTIIGGLLAPGTYRIGLATDTFNFAYSSAVLGNEVAGVNSDASHLRIGTCTNGGSWTAGVYTPPAGVGGCGTVNAPAFGAPAVPYLDFKQ